MKNLVRIFFVLLCLVATAYFLPTQLNLNHKKKEISEIINVILNIDADVKGDIHFQLIPTPKVFISQVQISKDGASIELYRVNIKTSFSSILGKGFEINSIEVENTQFYEEDKPIIEYLFSGKSKNDTYKLEEIGLKNIGYVDNTTGLGRITNITGDLLISSSANEASKIYKFKGGFIISGVSYFLDSQIYVGAGEDESSFNLDSELFKLSFDGGVSSINPIDLKGILNIEFKGKEIRQDGILVSWLNSDKSSIEASLEYSPKKFILQDIKANGVGLNGLTGNIEYDVEFNNIFNAAISIKKLDFDMHLAELKNPNKGIENLKNNLRSILTLIDFELPTKIDGELNFSLDELIFNKQSIKGINLSAKIIEGKFLIPDININLPANSKIALKGSLTNNQIRTKFDGSLDLVTEDLKSLMDWIGIENNLDKDSAFKTLRLKSDLIIIPRNIRLENIRSLVGEVRAIGLVSLKAIDNENVGIKTTLRFDNIDSDKLGLPKAIHSIVTNSFVFDYDRTGTKFIDSLNDFHFLRSFPLHLDAELQIDSLIYRAQRIGGFNTRFTIDPNKIKIDRLNFSTPSGELYTNLGLSVSGIRPEINGQIRILRMNDKFLTYLFPDLSILRDVAEKYKVTNSPKKNSEELKKSTVVDPLLFADYGNINFFSLDKFTGNVELIVDGYNSKDLQFDNLNATLVLNNGVIGIPSITVNIFDGQFSAIGNIILVGNVPSINTSFQLNNFNPQLFTKYFYDSGPIKGYMSLSGGVTASGFKFSDIVSRATGNVTFAGKKVTWLGFDIGEILKTSEQKTSLSAKVDRFNYYSNNGETVFNDVDGVMKIGSGFATITNVKLSNNRANGSFASNLSILNGAISSVAKLSFIPFGTQIPITISINSKGLMNDQETKIEADQLINFFNQQSRISGSILQEDQSQSLLRNRRL